MTAAGVPPRPTGTMARHDIGVLAVVVSATVAADLAARSWLVGVFEDHPMSLGPLVLKVHRHVGSAFGFTRVAPSMLLAIGAVVVAVAVIAARHRSVIHATTSTGLIAGGLIAYATDKMSDGAITEFVRVGPLPAAGVSGIAVVAGVIGLVLDTWARNEPASAEATES